VRYADPAFVTNSALGSSPSTDAFVRTTIGTTGSFANGGDSTIKTTADKDGTYNYPFDIDVYFLRPCSNKAGTTCASTDDGGDPIPTLARLSLVNGQLVQQTLIEDVEQLQLEYGLDTNSDATADIYTTAATVNSSYSWDDVVSVRVSIVVRSQTKDTNLPSGTTSFSMAGSYTYSVTNDDYRRRLFTHVVQVRNRTRG
jgi:type IV pilus assembly protein PilW